MRLARLFKNLPVRAPSRRIAGNGPTSRLAPSVPDPQTRCLTLLGTTGLLPEWRDRREVCWPPGDPASQRSRYDPVPDDHQLVRQLGGGLGSASPCKSGLLVDQEPDTFNVFHVADAVGSACIPAQADFVARHGVRSVLGFGGLLPGHDLFAVILFSRVPISRSTAELFRPLALCVKLALLPFVSGPAFQSATEPKKESAVAVVPEADALASRVAVLEQLLDVVEPTIMDQSSQLELALAEAQNLLESAADAILIADGDGRIVRLNQEAERMFGYTREALVGQPVELLIPEPVRARHVLLRRAYVAQPPPRRRADEPGDPCPAPERRHNPHRADPQPRRDGTTSAPDRDPP